MLRILLLGLIVIALPAHGIGRSGNGTGNLIGERDGFVIGKIQGFGTIAQVEAERVRLLSPIVETSTATKLFVEVSGAHEGLPLLAKLPRNELITRMEKLGWSRVDHTNPCVEAFRQSVDTGDKLALFWGGKKGIVAIGPKSANVAVALDEIRDKLTLEKGACAW